MTTQFPEMMGSVHRVAAIAWQHLSGENGVAILLLWGTLLLAGIVTYVRTRPTSWSIRDFLRHMFPAEIVRSQSARADFLFWLSRRIFMPILVVPLAVSTIAAGKFAYWVLTLIFGAPTHPAAPAGPIMLVGFSVTMLLAYDLS